MNVLMPLVEGFEDIEAVTVIDILKRAGINVVTAGSPSTMIKSMHGVTIMANKRFDEVAAKDFDAIVLPGGDPGYKNLERSQSIINIVKDFAAGNKAIGAICAAPLILARLGLLDGKIATIYPGMERNLPKPRANRVVVDGNIITSQGPGTAIEFALKLVEVLDNKVKSERIRREIVC
jgi:4-methyl-5(b-hydroxyethyl)-thiazole monophosphate biosynthesis